MDEQTILLNQLYDNIRDKKNSELDQLIDHIQCASEHIHFAQKLFREGALTEKERKSNEGVHFGSALWFLIEYAPKVEQPLNLIKIFRDPEGNKEFIEKLNSYAREEGAELFAGSLIPPEVEEKTND